MVSRVKIHNQIKEAYYYEVDWVEWTNPKYHHQN